MKWKRVKWWLVGFFALLWAIWVGGSTMPAQANPTEQDIFTIGGDVIDSPSCYPFLYSYS